jgi:hypothetical protein
MSTRGTWTWMVAGTLAVLACAQPQATTTGQSKEREPDPQPEPEPEPKPEPEPEPKPEPEPEPKPEPKPEPEPEPSVHAPMLEAHAGAPVVVRDELVHDGHTYVVYAYNTLDAMLGGMKAKARKQAIKTMADVQAKCEARQKQALAATEDAWEQTRIENELPCDVEAARAIRPRPLPELPTKHYTRFLDDVSPRCDALALARLDESNAIVAEVQLIEDGCADSFASLERIDFTGDGPQIAVSFGRDVYADLLGGWGWGIDSGDTTLIAYDLRGGGLAPILDIPLSQTEYLEDVLESECRYRIDAPGVVTRHWEAWNLPSDDPAMVDQIRWDPRRRKWSEPVDLPLEQGIPADKE